MKYYRYLITALCLLAASLSASAKEASGGRDSISRQLSIEFRRYYIDGDEEKLYGKANELTEYLRRQPEFDHHLYYMTLIDVVSFDMNKGHYYRAMKKARELMAEMKENKHIEEYYNGSYMMAIIYWYRNNLPLASKFFEQAIREVNGENRIDLASIYTDYGNMLTDEDPDKAAQLIEQALKVSGNNSYRLTYALTMKGIVALKRRDGATVLDCYRRYQELKQSHKPEDICDMYESHLELAAMTVNGRHKEALVKAEEELDESDRYAIQLDIYDYIGDKATAYGVLRKLMKAQENQNNMMMEDDINEMASDLQVIKAKRETARSMVVFLTVLIILAAIIIVCMVVLVISRRRSLQQLRQAYDQLEETTTVKERIESELRIARDIQMSMVPSQFPTLQGIDIYASMTPAREVGGDLYDYLIIGQQLYFCIGDVSGKGVPASLFMAQTLRLLRALAKQQMSPSEIATRLNAELSENNDSGMFVTMFIGLIDLSTGHISFCNCGHNPPVLIDQYSKAQFLEMEPNAPIGLWQGLEFEGEEIMSIKGCQLFIYTDGLNEAENALQEQFGDDRLLYILSHSEFSSARLLVETLNNEVVLHRNSNEPNDDLTMLCLRLTTE